jgi:hypothetical protein
MSMSDIWNIMLIVFAISGALSWLFVIFVGLFYWACSRPPQEE